MDILQELLHALWQQDFKVLSTPNLVWSIYLLVFVILFLENGILPAAFLPGDSLLILLGVLIAKGILNFPLTLLLLTTAASLGSWISYLQGKWLENNRLIKRWLVHLPDHYHQRAHRMFHRHGLSALLIGRFVAFVRTLLPTIAELSGLGSSRFHFFNWVSAFVWVFILTLTGYLLGKTALFQRYEEKLMFCLILLPLAFLTIGLLSSLVVFWKKKQINTPSSKIIKSNGSLHLLLERSSLLLLTIVILVSLTLLLPTWFNDNSGLRITSIHRCSTLPDKFYLYQLLEKHGMRVKNITPTIDNMIIQMNTPEEALEALLILQNNLAEDYTIKSYRYSGWQWLSRLISREKG